MSRDRDIAKLLAGVVGENNVLTGDEIPADYGHDEALKAVAQKPSALVRPGCTEEVAAICSLANQHRFGLTARGSGTGLSGAAIPTEGGVLVSFERMNRVLEIDQVNRVAVVQPGVTLEELDRVAAPHGLAYQVFPGEYSASLGGNIATNAGGMRAVKYGVTRDNVLGLEAILATGEVIRTGGKFLKSTSGYDLTQLIIGSEGTLALVTEATLKLYPRLPHLATVLSPFTELAEVTAAVPEIIGRGIAPVILEYIDKLTMHAITANVKLDLGIPQEVKDAARAYLMVVLESARPEHLDEDVATLGELLLELGAMEAYVLPAQASTRLIEAREKAFFVARAEADELVDVVVPRAALPEYMAKVEAISKEHGSFVTGCGHAGDGNVHLTVYQPDSERRSALLTELLCAGMDLGGVISGEHGIGTEKKRYFIELEDPVKLALMRRIKAAFDPNSILGPGTIFD